MILILCRLAMRRAGKFEKALFSGVRIAGTIESPEQTFAFIAGNHWQRVFAVVLAGGGVARGTVFGASNATGAEPERDPVRPADLAATVFAQLGIDPAKKLEAPGGRPLDLVRDGRVLTGVLA